MKTMKSHGIDPDIVRQNRKQAAAVEQMAITLDILCWFYKSHILADR